MTLTIKNKKVKAKPMKDAKGNDGYFIPAKELSFLEKPTKSKPKRPSIYPEVKEALEEMKLMVQGKLKTTEAKEWLKSR